MKMAASSQDAPRAEDVPNSVIRVVKVQHAELGDKIMHLLGVGQGVLLVGEEGVSLVGEEGVSLVGEEGVSLSLVGEGASLVGEGTVFVM